MPSKSPSLLSGLYAASTVGFEFVQPVLGASVYAIPANSYGCMGWGTTQVTEIPNYEQAVRECRNAAIARLKDETKAIHAHGVIGATLRSEWIAAGFNTMQVQLVGTAVRHRGSAVPERPFTSGLSAQDFARLLRGGWVPAGIASGFAAVHVHGFATSPYRVGGPGFKNAEMDAITAALALVRQRAQESLRASAAANRAEGVVGVQVALSHRSQACQRTGLATKSDGWLIEASAVGTSIVRFRRRAVRPTVVRRLTQPQEAL